MATTRLAFGGARSAVALLVILGVFVLGCGKTDDDDDGGECTSLCERASECTLELDDPDEPEPDCATQCGQFERAASSIGCSSELDAYYRCIADLSDICTGVDACTAELDSLSRCFNDSTGGGCTDGGPTTNATCESLCMRQQACTGETRDCVADCTLTRNEAAQSGCTLEYQGYLDCLSSCDDICELTSLDCESSQYSYDSCIGLL